MQEKIREQQNLRILTRIPSSESFIWKIQFLSEKLNCYRKMFVIVLPIWKNYNIVGKEIQRVVKWGRNLEISKNLGFWQKFLDQKVLCEKFSFYPNNKTNIEKCS